MACGNRFLRAQLLQPNGMTRGEAVCVATINVPARANIATVTQVGRIESQTGDDGEGVTAARIDSDPPATTAFAVTEKITRWQRCLEKIVMIQRERDGPRAVVAVIVERAVAAAPEVRFAMESVRRPDGALHVHRGIRWRVGDSIAQDSAAAGNNRTSSLHRVCFYLRNCFRFVLFRNRFGAREVARRVIGDADGSRLIKREGLERDDGFFAAIGARGLRLRLE